MVVVCCLVCWGWWYWLFYQVDLVVVIVFGLVECLVGYFDENLEGLFVVVWYQGVDVDVDGQV